MSYKIEKGINFTDKDKSDFIVQFNHNKGLRIEDTERFLFALEPNEIMGEKEIDEELIPYPIIDEEYETKQAEREKARIANLHMTRGDVFRGILLSKGITRAEIRGIIEVMSEETPQEKINKEMALIDFDEALEFYRGVPLIDTLGSALGISKNQMDEFFETKDYTKLLTEPKDEV